MLTTRKFAKKKTKNGVLRYIMLAKILVRNHFLIQFSINANCQNIREIIHNCGIKSWKLFTSAKKPHFDEIVCVQRNLPNIPKKLHSNLSVTISNCKNIQTKNRLTQELNQCSTFRDLNQTAKCTNAKTKARESNQ